MSRQSPTESENSCGCCWLANQLDKFMKSFLNFALIIFLIFIVLSSKVNASDIGSIQNNSQKINSEKIAEKFCSAKADNFFEGLGNEKTLKYSYFRYIVIESNETFSKDIYEHLINQIRGKCLISKEEEKELYEFLLEGYED